jgi:CRISPR type IV-associated protein Csf3
MDSANMPMRIRATLRAPVVADQWLPLDGVLFYQQTRNDLGGQDLTTPGRSSLAEPKGGPVPGGRLPLAIVHARDWYYKCSWAQWGPHADGVEYWAKRFDNPLADLVDFRGRRGKIDTSAGEYKAYRMPLYYRAALWVEWYCVGNAEKIAPLLYMVTHLGKKSSQGWGRVARWEIEPIGEDWSIWRDGTLMRGIPRYHWPRERGVPLHVGLYGTRPSYWDRRNQMELVLPDG